MKRISTLAAAGFACVAASALAQDVTLPPTISWTAYDLGSTSYNQAVAMGAALKDAYGVNLRILPGKNDIARSAPLRTGRVDFSATGVGSAYFAQEALQEFSARDWGPQPVRLILMNNAGNFALTIAVTRQACETAGKPGCEGFGYEDLRGLRVGYIIGAPSVNNATASVLAYANLTWDDVEVVEFGGYGDSIKALGSGVADAAFSATTSGGLYEQVSNPRGLFWPSMDPENAEGLARMKAVLPFMDLVRATTGAGLDGTDGVINAAYPYPFLITMTSTSDDYAYSMTRALVEQFDAYDGKAPTIEGWALDKQKFNWLVPFHDGAIRYFKEVGVWTEEAQANNDALLARQALLADAWAGLKQEDPADWNAAWAQRRREVLTAAGLPAPM